MGRYRPPQPPSSAYITRTGFESLRQEQKDLWTKRSDVVKALSAAAAEGDRSENAEYIYRKKELAGIDRRIRYLQKRLPILKIVDPRVHKEKIYFGAWVELETEDGETVTYRIVGPDETDAKLGFISMDSPMARQILGKQLDDEIRLTIKDRQFVYWVAGIWYHAKP